jgi:sterol desaturase/sphingolipid hydroxylase (fatty acid hydroxylase superfamily)
MGNQAVKPSEGTQNPNNEELADQIQKEWRFRIKRAPENIIIRCGIVPLVLFLLEGLLIVSNNFHYFGYWKWFISKSSETRDSIFPFLPQLDPYSLWRGWIVPSSLASGTYIVVSLLSLRHELYHWKPELLEHYLKAAKESKIGEYVPQATLDFAFHIYEDNHREYVNNRIQRQTHKALDDSKEFLKILRTVASNILISIIMVLLFWILLLQAHIEAENIVQLPRSYVPPLQGVIWYILNDLFYFYPHWIAHHSPSSDAFYYKLLPSSLATALYTHFNRSHKLHHKTKANLGIAAWYCSHWEQILFNIFPALIGPLSTQILASSFNLSEIWGTHLVTYYVWLMAASAESVLAHTGYRSKWNDPGKHDLHHERAFNPKMAVNFGTLGFFDWLHGTKSQIPSADAEAWRMQRDRQAALWEASRRTDIELTKEQMEVVRQPDHSQEWADKTI